MLWGIDLGGTKIEGVVISLTDGMKVHKRMRIPTSSEKGYNHILNQIKALLDIIEADLQLKPDRIGIGTPGTIDPISKTMKNCNTTCLNGKFLLQDLEELLGIKVTIANDANCFAIAEASFGAGKEIAPNAESVFGVIMGTGVGGGLVINGKILQGRHGLGGEWGHNFLDSSGGNCYCGKIGCVETILSGPAIEKYYQSLTSNYKSLAEISKLQHEGDQAAIETIDRLVHYFGKAMATIINIIDPELIIIGGGVGNLDVLYSKGVQEVSNHIFNPIMETKFVKPKLGDSAGVFGAALL